MEPVYKINFVKKDKDKLVQLVEPNFIYNRFDVFYDNEYELIEILSDNRAYYIPIRIDLHTAKLGLYMTKLPQKAFDELIDFIFKLYRKVDFIEIRHSLNPFIGLKEGNQFTIELPKTEDEYLNSLGKKTRLHIKQYFKYINRDFSVKFKTFDKDIPSEVVRAYYKFKQETVDISLNCNEIVTN